MNRKCPSCEEDKFVSTEEVYRSGIPEYVLFRMYGKNRKSAKKPRPWWFCSGCGYSNDVIQFYSEYVGINIK